MEKSECTDSKKLKKLFEPIKIGPYTLKNRIVKAPTGTSLAFLSGDPSPEQLYLYEEIARGGVAMVVVEVTQIEKRTSLSHRLSMDSDAFITGLRRLVEVIHLNGSLVSMQLGHLGTAASNPIAPSDVPVISGGKLVRPTPMTAKEIEEVRDGFIAAAVRTKLAGFDMVELHGGTVYLLNSFVSPHTNRRTDMWGGSFENRIRLPLEIIRGIREKCGADFPIGYRIVADEFVPDGINLEHAIAFAKRLEQEGVAYLSVHLISPVTIDYTIVSMRCPPMINKYTAAFKKEVSIPIFAGQQIHEPEFMEEILEKGEADVILLGRPLFTDPQLPKKAFEGRLDDICMCIRCCHCFEPTTSGPGAYARLSCTQNPAFARGREWAIQPATSPKEILVVGGGAAGLEAARVAALRGHDVTLVEKNSQLGGQTLIASLPIGKQHLKPYIIDWRERQCNDAGVKIQLNREVTPEFIDEVKPEVVIIAAGATPSIPPIPGVTEPHVVTAWDVLRKPRLEKRVVVAGGGQVGVETADFIAEKGLAESVTIIEMLPEIAIDMDAHNRAYITKKLSEYNVKVLTDTKIEEITDKGIVAINKKRERHPIEADTVVLALGAVPKTNLAEALKTKVPELYTIGDCVKPRKVTDAILEGSYVSRQI